MPFALTSSGQLQHSRSAPVLKSGGVASAQVCSFEQLDVRVAASTNHHLGVVSGHLEVHVLDIVLADLFECLFDRLLPLSELAILGLRLVHLCGVRGVVVSGVRFVVKTGVCFNVWLIVFRDDWLTFIEELWNLGLRLLRLTGGVAFLLQRRLVVGGLLFLDGVTIKAAHCILHGFVECFAETVGALDIALREVAQQRREWREMSEEAAHHLGEF